MMAKSPNTEMHKANVASRDHGPQLGAGVCSHMVPRQRPAPCILFCHFFLLCTDREFTAHFEGMASSTPVCPQQAEMVPAAAVHSVS